MHWRFPEGFFVIRPGTGSLPRQKSPGWKTVVTLTSWFSFPSSGSRGSSLYVQISVPGNLTGEGFVTQKVMFRAGLGFPVEVKLPGKKPILQNQSTSQMYIGYSNYHKQKTQPNEKKTNNSHQLAGQASGKPGFPRSAAVPQAVCRVGTPGFPGSWLCDWWRCSKFHCLAVAPKVPFTALGSTGALGTTFEPKALGFWCLGLYFPCNCCYWIHSYCGRH